MHWTGGWLSGEEEHFESSEKSSCASEPLRAPTTDYQVHRGGENLSLDWNRHLNAYAACTPKTDFLREKTVWRKCSFPALPEQRRPSRRVELVPAKVDRLKNQF